MRLLLALHAASLLGLLALLTTSGCNPYEDDYYSMVAEACSYTVRAKSSYPIAMSKILETTLTPECHDALEAVLPFDDESFAAAPAGTREKVIEAFQVLVGYPLAIPPEHRLLGVAPGRLPTGLICIFTPQLFPDECFHSKADTEVNLNRNLFNYVLNQIDRIYYASEETGYTTARYRPDSPHVFRRALIILNNFWKPDSSWNAMRNRFARASSLIHEARHGDEYVHVPCANGKFECDSDLNGPYGLQLLYLVSLIHGSASLETADGEPLMHPFEFGMIGADICGSLSTNQALEGRRFAHLPAELTERVKDVDCYWMKNSWILDMEGISTREAVSGRVSDSLPQGLLPEYFLIHH